MTPPEALDEETADAVGPAGRFRIYMGAAAGVGKTFAMLDEGRRRQLRGADVVIGFVETHGRPRTSELVRDLPIVARQRVEHRGRVFEEMDLAAVLARAPEVTVISGSRLLEVERQMNGGTPSVPGAIVPVARQAGATTLIDGALYPLGDTLRLDLRVTNLRNGNVLRLMPSLTIPRRYLFGALDQLLAVLAEA